MKTVETNKFSLMVLPQSQVCLTDALSIPLKQTSDTVLLLIVLYWAANSRSQ